MSKKTLTGLPVVEVDNLPALEGVTLGNIERNRADEEAQEFHVVVDLPPDPMPIADALLQLRPLLTPVDCEALGNLSGVRTLGDLRTVLERGEVEGALGKKLRQVLG